MKDGGEGAAGGSGGADDNKKKQEEDEKPTGGGGDQSSDDAAEEKKKREKKSATRNRYRTRHRHDRDLDEDYTEVAEEVEEKKQPTRKRHRLRDSERISDEDDEDRTTKPVAVALSPESPLDPPWSAERKRMSSECRAFGVCTRAIKSLADSIVSEMPPILSEPNRTSVKVFLKFINIFKIPQERAEGIAHKAVEYTEEWDRLEKKWNAGTACVGVVGLEKMGKSKFITGWIGQGNEIVPSNTLRCTWAATRIKHRDAPPYYFTVTSFTESELMRAMADITASIDKTTIDANTFTLEDLQVCVKNPMYINLAKHHAERWSSSGDDALKEKAKSAIAVCAKWSVIRPHLTGLTQTFQCETVAEVAEKAKPYIALVYRDASGRLVQGGSIVHATKFVELGIPVPGANRYVDVDDLPGIDAPTKHAKAIVRTEIQNNIDLLVFVHDGDRTQQFNDAELDLLGMRDLSDNEIPLNKRCAIVVAKLDRIKNRPDGVFVYEKLAEYMTQFVRDPKSVFFVSATRKCVHDGGKDPDDLKVSEGEDGYRPFVNFVEDFLTTRLAQNDNVIVDHVKTKTRNLVELATNFVAEIKGRNVWPRASDESHNELLNLALIPDPTRVTAFGLFPKICSALFTKRDELVRAMQKRIGACVGNSADELWKCVENTEANLRSKVKRESIIHTCGTIGSAVTADDSISHRAQEVCREAVNLAARAEVGAFIEKIKFGLDDAMNELFAAMLDAGETYYLVKLAGERSETIAPLPTSPPDAAAAAPVPALVPSGRTTYVACFRRALRRDDAEPPEPRRKALANIEIAIKILDPPESELKMCIDASEALRTTVEMNVMPVVDMFGAMPGTRDAKLKAVRAHIKNLDGLDKKQTKAAVFDKDPLWTPGSFFGPSRHLKTVAEFESELRNEVELCIRFIHAVLTSTNGFPSLFTTRLNTVLNYWMHGPGVHRIASAAGKYRSKIWPHAYDNEAAIARIGARIDADMTRVHQALMYADVGRNRR